MNKFKKSLILLPVAACVLGLAACGGNNSGKTKITFWHTMGSKLQTVLDSMIERFNVENPDIVIEHASQGGYDDLEEKITDAIPAGTTPTMAFCYPDHVAEYMESKAVQNLDEFIKGETTKFTEQDGLVSDFIESYWKEGQSYKTAGTFSVPWAKSTETMFYNKTEFENSAKHASGKSYKVPTTWEELDSLFAEMKADYPDKICLGYDSDANLFITLCEQYGIPYTSLENGQASCLFNNDAAKAMVKKLVEWYDAGYITTQGTSNGSYTSTQFTEGTLLMTIGSTGGAGYNFTENFEIGNADVMQPSSDESIRFKFGGTLAVSNHIIMQGPSICFFRNSSKAQREAAWKFYKFCVRSLNSVAYSLKSGYSPIRNSCFQEEAYINYINSTSVVGEDKLVQAVLKRYETLKTRYYVSPAFHGSSACRTQVDGIFANVAMKTKTLDQAFADAFAKAQFAMQ